ncbi:hypothetical protein P280DRAFT_177818 [Massarina eburnea CBS 473.64]|uniref:Uncharacterized protein n=1 Tax=Massarina eburnea CBS 473.64 TaxID=1395130 RepID=A0A6A6SAA1_9PLEO|nr:hypothetical protein P280DRAFT_177818 [Massarina eburnea CBS 473.64]
MSRKKRTPPPTPTVASASTMPPSDHQWEINALNDYVVQLIDNNTKLAEQKAKAVREMADYSKRHADMSKKHAGMIASLDRRMSEKNDIIQENAKLVKGNADLRFESANLIKETMTKDRRIKELEKDLEEANHILDSNVLQATQAGFTMKKLEAEIGKLNDARLRDAEEFEKVKGEFEKTRRKMEERDQRQRTEIGRLNGARLRDAEELKQVKDELDSAGRTLDEREQKHAQSRPRGAYPYNSDPNQHDDSRAYCEYDDEERGKGRRPPKYRNLSWRQDGRDNDRDVTMRWEGHHPAYQDTYDREFYDHKSLSSPERRRGSSLVHDGSRKFYNSPQKPATLPNGKKPPTGPKGYREAVMDQ